MNDHRRLILKISLGIFLCLPASLSLFAGSFQKPSGLPVNVREKSFDEGWRFLKDSLPGPESADFDDSGWRVIDLPHDWSIEDLPDQNGLDIIGPFDKSAIDKGSSGYMIGGIGWYRKKFIIGEETGDKKVYLKFDGVCMRSDVWLNGKHLGFHPYAYTPFFYDITPYLNPPGQANVVAVRVRNEGMNSRWYTGSGINRHTWLIITDPVHIDISGGLYITTPHITRESAVVKVTSTIVNSGRYDENISLHTELLDASGKVVASITGNPIPAPVGKQLVSQDLSVRMPSLWS
ncbi:MAG: beta galactosidase jelly roll domain-containing protein, partial [Bacteroidales bacterium]|nr:beta galactosidase jelly roll domain-containing protein [Bacteroidales bacterium]